MYKIKTKQDIESFLLTQCKMDNNRVIKLINIIESNNDVHYNMEYILLLLDKLYNYNNKLSNKKIFNITVAIIFQNLHYKSYISKSESIVNHSIISLDYYLSNIPYVYLKDIEDMLKSTLINDINNIKNSCVVFWRIYNYYLLNPEIDNLHKIELSLRKDNMELEDSLYIFSRLRFYKEFLHNNIFNLNESSITILKDFINNMFDMYNVDPIIQKYLYKLSEVR